MYLNQKPTSFRLKSIETLLDIDLCFSDCRTMFNWFVFVFPLRRMSDVKRTHEEKWKEDSTLTNQGLSGQQNADVGLPGADF